MVDCVCRLVGNLFCDLSSLVRLVRVCDNV